MLPSSLLRFHFASILQFFVCATVVASGLGLNASRLAFSASQTPPDDSLVGAWVAWLETPSQHLRLILKIEKDSPVEEGTQRNLEGSIASPDQTQTSLPLSEGRVADGKAVEFRVVPSATTTGNYAFLGQRDGDILRGSLEQNGATLPLTFRRVDRIPEEGDNRLGADSIWVGDIDLVVQKLSFRLRVYNRPPYATEDSPRVLFDSPNENVNGFPVSIALADDSQIDFSIAGIPGNAKYTARLNEALELFQGQFVQNQYPLGLELARSESMRELPLENDALVRTVARLQAAEQRKSSIDSKSPSDAMLRPESKNAVDSKNVFREDSFSIERIDYSKPKEKKDDRWLQPTFKISGTITWPAAATPEDKLPVVVMISGSGPQDRDETIGVHKPFQQLAHWFAKNGVVSLRYDDRGVGQSTGDFLNATTANFADDAMDVWQYARALDGIDPLRVGLLGHSEGGIAAPLVAASQGDVAFLILLAPPGLPGSEILTTQIDRISELQGVSVEDRIIAIDLQKDLQRLALELPSDSPASAMEIRKAVASRWDKLKTLSQSAPGQDDATRKKQVVDQMNRQFQGLRTPWMQYFLAYDPSTNWLLFDCPTLAIWGERDTQVLPYANRERLLSTIERNPQIKAEMVVLPELNHLLQRSKTGLPDEYDSLTETIDPVALDKILSWMKQNNILP